MNVVIKFLLSTVKCKMRSVFRKMSVLFQTSGCSATAKGLKPGHLYQFEVSAINKEGQSEPIFTGDPILAENPYREHRQNRTINVFFLKNGDEMFVYKEFYRVPQKKALPWLRELSPTFRRE